MSQWELAINRCQTCVSQCIGASITCQWFFRRYSKIRLGPFHAYTQTYNMTLRNSQTALKWDIQQCNKTIAPPSLFSGGLYCPFIEILTPKHQESIMATVSYQVHPSCNECDILLTLVLLSPVTPFLHQTCIHLVPYHTLSYHYTPCL